jgi:hypothetical protein
VIMPIEEDKHCFSSLSLAFDVSSKHGFVLIVHHIEQDMLRYIARALLFYKVDLLFLERFKVKAGGKKSGEYEYFGILKVKIPRGVVVSAPMVKAEIELRMEDVVRLFAHAYRIYKPDYEHDLLSGSIE